MRWGEKLEYTAEAGEYLNLSREDGKVVPIASEKSFFQLLFRS